MRFSLMLLKNVSEREFEISRISTLLLIQVCTVKINRFYIPGETSISERLRKQAYDSGCYTLMHFLNKELSNDDLRQKDIKSHIREKVLNWLDLADL